MRLVDGRYVCSHCGQELPVPLDGLDPHVVIRAAAGRENVRTLMYDGREVHRCTVDPLPLRPPEPKTAERI